jgi:RNA polymerase sigma factor (sigma-70 family)
MADCQLTTVLNRLRRAALRHDGAGLSDGELLDCFIAQRDEAAFEALVRRHGPMVLGVCQRILRNEADAEDAFQATFLVLVRKAPSVRPRALVGNWLYGVAHNTARKARTMNLRRRQKERAAAALPVPSAPKETWEELNTLLDRVLPALPDKYRAPIVLCDLEGNTLLEAARHLGWPQGTVATRLARARELLALRLARSGLKLSVGALTLALAQGAAAASVPTSMVVLTVKAATLVAAGQAAAGGVISTKVAALSEGVLKAMLWTRLKALASVLLAVALLGAGGFLVTYHTLWAEPQAARQADPPLAAGQKGEKAKSDKELLQGTWVAVSGERAGQELPKEAYWQITFDGDSLTIQFGEAGKVREGTYALDPDKKPKEIRVTLGAATLSGIYELKGTTLKTAWREGAMPPTAFDSMNSVLMVFEKKK